MSEKLNSSFDQLSLYDNDSIGREFDYVQSPKKHQQIHALRRAEIILNNWKEASSGKTCERLRDLPIRSNNLRKFELVALTSKGVISTLVLLAFGLFAGIVFGLFLSILNK